MKLHTPMLSLLICLAGWSALPSPAAETPDVESLKKQIVHHHADIIHATYSDALNGARQMEQVVEKFLAAPDAESLARARKAWLNARRPYLYSEAFRYYTGPIDDPDGPEPLLNSWPLDEGIIDSVPGSPVLSIIANEKDYPNLTGDVIESLNQQEGERAITCGYHAVEFLLWGQDLSTTGPGDRPHTDYTTAPHATRRAAYLRACCHLICTHLEELTADWAPDQLGNFRAVFEEGYEESIQRRILYGLVFLTGTELAGERLQVAWDTQEQEEEHSCFSDSTHLDNQWDAEGMLHVWTGRYARPDGSVLDGPGLRDLAQAVQPDMARKITTAIEEACAAAAALPPPFDQAITGPDDSPGRKAVLRLMTAVGEVSTFLRTLARSMGNDIPAEAPEEIEG